jgi:hypothetical protein
MTDANEVEFGNQASKVRLQDEVGKIKNRQGEACIEVIDNQNVGIGTDSPDRRLEILDASNPQLRLTHTDNTEYVEFQSLSTGDAAIEMTDSNMWLRSGDSNCYLMLQNTTTGQTDSTVQGLTISTFGLSAGINMNGPGSTLKFGAAGLNAITIDASNNTTAIYNLTTNGNVTLGDAGGDVHTLNGTLQFAQEVDAPSAPGSGDGGIFYVKTDGIPYFISNSTAETALTGGGGGGGGLTVTAVATGDSPVTGAVDTVYIVNSSGGNVEIDLPAVSGNSGKTIDVLHKTTGNDCIIDPNASETINGSSTSITMSGVAFQNVTLICDGTEWYIR